MQLPSNSSPAPRVLHVSQPVDGGVARVVTDLVRAQRAAGMDVHLACPDGGTLARSAGPVPVHPWAAARSPGPGLRAEVRDLARIVDAVRPTLVHAHSAKAGLAARVAVRGRVPTVFQPHAWSFEAVDGGVALLARTWERHAARWTARTLCVSAAERDTGRRAGITGPCSLVPNGIDPQRFAPADRRAARAELLAAGEGGWGVDASRVVGAPRLDAPWLDAPWVVCVGRLCRQKGQDVLLRAWPTVAERVPGARLVLVGDGPDAEELRAGLGEAAGLGEGAAAAAGLRGAEALRTGLPDAGVLRTDSPDPGALRTDSPDPAGLRAGSVGAAVLSGAVDSSVTAVGSSVTAVGSSVTAIGSSVTAVGSSVTFVGAAEDTAPWYRAADVVVQPSRWEGMALAPLEAMSCARPVVLTDVDGARESLPPAHHAHALVPPEDPDALADALTALLRDPALRESLGAQGRAHVLSHHDVRRTAAAVEAVYRELLGPAPTEHRECSTT